MQERFAELNVPKQFAGRHVAEGMKQLTSGMANLSKDWQMFIAERLGYGKGLEGRQAMLEAHTRIAKEGGYEDLMKQFHVLAQIALELTGGNEVEARAFMETSMGLGFKGAELAIEIMKAMDKGDIVSAKAIAKEHENELRDSLGMEKEKRTTWELKMNEWMDAVSIMGEGLLGLLINLSALIAAFVKALPTLLVNFFTDKDKENEALLQRIAAVTSGADKAWDTTIKGLHKAEKVASDMGLGVLGDSISALKAAVNLDLTGKGSKDKPYL
jgi:hypothetical protein